MDTELYNDLACENKVSYLSHLCQYFLSIPPEYIGKHLVSETEHWLKSFNVLKSSS